VQGNLSDLYSRAADMAGQNQGYLPYPGDLQAPLNDVSAQGLSSDRWLAASELGGTQGVNVARALGTSLLGSGGLTADQQGVAGNLQSLFDQAQGQQNPYLLDTIAANNRQIADKVNSSVSGAGRYGSAAHTDVLSRSLAESADPILAQDYQQRQQQALQTAGSLANLYQSGQDTAGKWAQLMPTLDEAQYAPSQHLQQVGDVFQQRDAQELANQVAVWNANQSRDWENLQRYAGILSGAGGLGGTKVTTTTPAAPSLLQSVGGGAVAGAGLGSIFGPAGAGIGAAGGGLLGLLGR
jgi:hypothetical protein